jgi:hypothetical protein
MRPVILLLTGWLALLVLAGPAPAQADSGAAEFTVTDKATGKPVPCRVHLKDAAGKPQRAGKLPFWHDHFVCPGTARLELPPGKYTFECERGPEYTLEAGAFTVAAGAAEKVAVRLERVADLAAEGWWSGELHVHRPVEDIELLMRAEDLHVAPVITWWNNRNLWADRKPPADPLVRFDGDRWYHVLAGEDEREGGALLYFHLPEPLAIAGAGREHPSPLKFAAEARKHPGAWIDAEKPFWWDVPVWLAAGQVDSIGLANNHMCRGQMYENEAWGKPRVSERLPPPLGNGFWSQEIYYHLLNCGLRVPPSAGSASGVLPNPVGYNRVYVHVARDFDHGRWWEGLRAGRSFVTNGPLLRVRADGELPGHVFTAAEGQEVKVEVKVVLTTRDPVPFVEVIKDGEVERAVPFAEVAKTGTLGSVTFKKSGWFLVRALTDNKKTFRFASTAPFYVEVGGEKRRVSKASARFFLEWVRERQGRVKLDDAAQREEVLKHHAAAEKFWREVVERANAE